MSCGTEQTAGLPDAEEKMIPRKKVDTSICIRCKEVKGVLVVKHTTYCKSCLSTHLVAKFHASLKPYSPPTSSRPPVLLAVSGGSSSVSMLDMFYKTYLKPDEAGNESRRSEIWGPVVVGYINCSEAGVDSPNLTDEINSLAASYSLPFISLKLSDAFDPSIASSDVPEHLQSSSSASNAAKLTQLLTSLPSTSQPQILTSLLSSLLLRLTMSLKTSETTPQPYLLTSLSATRLSTNFISLVSSGRGYPIPLLMSPGYEHDIGAKEVRVMREIGSRESAWYAHVNKLNDRFGEGSRGVVNWRGWGGAGSGRDGRGSIEKLTEDFISTLDGSHPSTVSTIARTAGKLVFSGEEQITSLLNVKGVKTRKSRNAGTDSSVQVDVPILSKKQPSSRVCPLCELPSDPSPTAWKALTSLTSLKQESEDEAQTQSLSSLLCYGCAQTISGGKKEIVEADLPFWSAAHVGQRRDGKEKILKDFLLEDDE